jgi:Skp family chaperone for outer membrane proteins
MEALDAEFRKYKSDLDSMNWDHTQKLKELEAIRVRSNEEIKKLSLELG